MTEYKCGSAKQCQFGDMCKPSYDIGGCNHFKQKKPQTNEEWIRTATTEQLAEHLLNVWMDGAFNVNAEFGLNEAQIEQHKGYIVEWLKQPHTPQKQDDYPCNVKGCSLETRQACCGCPDYFEWEKQNR